ncbi:hypothetical protein GC194_14825 [bacterium]|nr:hypothetical protein [bacterium]
MPVTLTFVVQGEGRGHLSQAIAMAEICEQLNFVIDKVYVGRSGERSLPDYFTRRFGEAIVEFKSPNFAHDSNNKGIRVGWSLFMGAVLLPKYIAISIKLARRIKKQKPHGVINFYEPLIGLSQLFVRLRLPIVCVAHQYFALHPKFKLPAKPLFDKIGLITLTYITQIGSHSKMALSFYPFENDQKRHIIAMPPLLRNKVYALQTSQQSFYLIYILNSGYAENVLSWHAENAEVEVHCFWDRFDLPEVYNPQPNLYFHHLSEEHFLQRMSACKALLTTAGFESVSEAIYLQKPVAMVPVKGHYEQKVNSFDALEAGAGVRNDDFDVATLIEKLNSFSHKKPNRSHDWVKLSRNHWETYLGGLFNK